MTVPLPNEVSGPALARLLGVSDREVRELARANIVVRTSRGRYRLEESVRRTFEHIRRTASQRGGEASLEAMREQRIRVVAAQAEAQELKNATPRGELLNAWRGRPRMVRCDPAIAQCGVGGAVAALPGLVPSGGASREIGATIKRCPSAASVRCAK